MTSKEDLVACAELIGSRLELVERVAKQCSTYYTNTLSAESVVYWLLQFGSRDAVETALRLLEQLNFIDSSKLTHLLTAAHAKIGADTSRAHYCVLGEAHDSGAVVGYEFLKAIGLEEEQSADRIFRLASPPETLRGPLVLVDDNITTGTQLCVMLAEMVGEVDGEREHFKHPLPEAALAVLRKVPLNLIVAIELGDGASAATAAAAKLGLTLKVWSGTRSGERWLEYGNKLWSSSAEAERARAPFVEIGLGLFEDKEWPQEKVEERALGYGSLQRLTVFSHNVPKSLISTFWKFGSYRGRPWLPLFPERREWAENQASIEKPDPALSLVAGSVMNGDYGQTAPALRAGVLRDDDAVQTVRLQLPSPTVARAYADEYAGDIKSPSPMKLPSKPPSGVPMPIGYGPTYSEVEAYNEALVAHDLQLREWRESVASFVEKESRLLEIGLRVYNDGTAHADEVVLTLELPPDTETTEMVPLPPDPPKPPEQPKSQMDVLISRPHLQNLAPEPERARRDSRQKVFRDRGVVKVQIFFGKIMQGSCRDRTFRYLRPPRSTQVDIRYHLVCEGQRMPVDGVLRLLVEDGEAVEMPEFLLDDWQGD